MVIVNLAIWTGDKMKIFASQKGFCIALSLCLLLGFAGFGLNFLSPASAPTANTTESDGDSKPSYIKWFEFDATNEVLTQAMKRDIASIEEDVKLDWIQIIACLAAKYGGDFGCYKTSDMDAVCEKLKAGTPPVEIAGSEKYYNYYYEGYRAALGGLVGDYEIETDTESGRQTVHKYGLKAFSPIAKGYGFNHYDDFGNSRTYGFARKHLGNDLMGSVGTPIIAVESGVVEALGWNQYGGWRIGIRSLDGMRYYYYAHLRKDRPYHSSLAVGTTVTAGDVIGYLGMSGYSTKENTNNINVPHLHFGLQLIFDESQKDSNNEIWIDLYDFVEFLQKNKSAVEKDDTKEFHRVYQMRDPNAFE